MRLLAWLWRWLGRSAPAPTLAAPETTATMDRSLAAAGLVMPETVSAADLLATIALLRQQSASWPAIIAAINPDADDQVQHLLEELRAPHLFTPHIGLNVLEAGCRRALAIDPAADRRSALQTALGDSSRIVGMD